MCITTLEMAILVVFAVVVAVVYFIVRVFNLTDKARCPDVFAAKNPFMDAIVKSCPIFFESYDPPLVWGKSGHLQTIVGATFGRTAIPELDGAENSTTLHDGTVVTYDVYSQDKQNSSLHCHQDKCVIIIVPGIANCSETKYVRTFVGYAVNRGFVVAVLNHLGAKKEKHLSTPRIFTYGGTEELAAVVKHLTSATSCRRLIGVGFSMGANILMKYLGEEPRRQELFECAISICQGYDIMSAKALLHDWDGFRRFYNWAITQNVKNIIHRHVRILFNGPNCTSPHKSSIHHVSSASSLPELDDSYVRKMAGFNHLDDFYEVNSSCNYMSQSIATTEGKIKIPVLLLNALDDPLVPQELFVTAHKHVKCNDSALFVVTRHGGHLGFYQGGIFSVCPITWLDKAVMQFIVAVIKVKKSYKVSVTFKQPEEYIIAS